MFGWILLILTWIWIVELSDKTWKMQCKGVEPEVQVVYKIPEPHMIVKSVEENTCKDGQCETKLWRTVESIKGEKYPMVTDDTPLTKSP